MPAFIMDYISQKKKVLDMVSIQEIKQVVDILFDAWKQGKQIFIFGNGGSASTASHFACDLGKGVSNEILGYKKRFPFIFVIGIVFSMNIGCSLKRDTNSWQPIKQKKTPVVHHVQNQKETLSVIAKWYTGDVNNVEYLANANPNIKKFMCKYLLKDKGTSLFFFSCSF